MKHFAIPLVIVCTGVLAQPVAAPDFPPAATPIAAKELGERLADKVFAVKLVDGSGWRLQYKSNGYFFVNTSTGFSGSGKWSTRDGTLCSGLKGNKESCNEVRQTTDALYLKRDSGEIIRLAPQ